MTFDDLAAWMNTAAPAGLGVATTVTIVPIDQVDDPGVSGQAVFVASTGGPGYMLDGATDVPTVQFRCQGDQGNMGDAYKLGESFALSIDMLMHAAEQTRPVIGDRQVVRISRVGGPPAYLLTRNRQAHFTASYAFELAAV